MPDDARAVAYQALLRIDHEGAYANLISANALAHSDLSLRDRRFVTELIAGTTRMRRSCDVGIDRFISVEPDPEIRTLLRLGTYQLAYAGVAPHAAVDRTVALAPRRARGFVNAVMRKLAVAPEPAWPSPAARLSYPDWLAERLVADLGAEVALGAMEHMNLAPPVSQRDDGYVQDLASQWVAALVGAEPGDRVLDACAAPGGKATALAATGALVVAGDHRWSRAGLITGAARRVGVSLPVVVADAVHPCFAPASFDRVLLDAPCSGLGALRRRPDARWRIRAADIDTLAALQRQMIAASAELVRPGGVLVYSVCTLTAAESVDHPVPEGFEALETPGGPWEAYGDGARLLPQRSDTDGMIVRRWLRHDRSRRRSLDHSASNAADTSAAR